MEKPKNKIVLVAITGTNGSGKGATVERLVDKWGFSHYSVRELLSAKLSAQGKKATRENLISVGNKLRKEYGPHILAEEMYKQALIIGGRCVIDSVRNPSEAIWLKSKARCTLLAVDARVSLRYRRIKSRKTSTDNVSFSEFKENELTEKKGKDSNSQNLTGCMKLADYKITNNGTLDELHKKIDSLVPKLI